MYHSGYVTAVVSSPDLSDSDVSDSDVSDNDVSDSPPADTIAVDAVQAWYDEINDYSYDTCDTTNGKPIGHFTQVTKNSIII